MNFSTAFLDLRPSDTSPAESLVLEPSDLVDQTDREASELSTAYPAYDDEIPSSGMTPRHLPPSMHSSLPPQEESRLLEKLDGVVTDVWNDEFRARFRDSDGRNFKAEFSKDDLTDDDQFNLAEGVPLIWSVIRERKNGGLQRSAILYLRRLAPPSESEIENSTESLNAWVSGSQ